MGRAIGQMGLLGDAPAVALAIYTHCLWLGGITNDEIEKGLVKGSFVFSYEASAGPPVLREIHFVPRDLHGHDLTLFASCDQQAPRLANELFRRVLKDSGLRFELVRDSPLGTLRGEFFPFGDIQASGSDGRESVRMVAEIHAQTSDKPGTNRYRIKYYKPKEHWWSSGDHMEDMELTLKIGGFDQFPASASIDDQHTPGKP